jgi:osmotically-inducible protein OsmY
VEHDVPDEKISVAVSNGWVTLKGNVDWEYQRTAADKCVRHLTGVCGLTNVIEVAPHVNVSDVKAKIEPALERSAEIDAQPGNVAVAGGKVTLSGNVHSWAERNEARYAAWAAPGVKEVDDRMSIVL